MSDIRERRRSIRFIKKARVFMRSKGKRGADVDTLRGNAGADFEGEAIVTRNTGLSLFGCCGNRDMKTKKYIVVKGPQIFVFSKDTSSSPKFAIPLKHQTVQEHDILGYTQVITLESGLGDVEYKFKFNLRENRATADNFCNVLREQIIVGNCEEVKDTPGHETEKTKSLIYAKIVADKKEKDQPDNPDKEVLGDVRDVLLSDPLMPL
mmetsp:Transcript_694/g.976  ORF Transcript_694/g.976 Transcript_694/m.976 type:complete len:208 (+) Transcript_694:187-810(+)